MFRSQAVSRSQERLRSYAAIRPRERDRDIRRELGLDAARVAAESGRASKDVSADIRFESPC